MQWSCSQGHTFEDEKSKFMQVFIKFRQVFMRGDHTTEVGPTCPVCVAMSHAHDYPLVEGLWPHPTPVRGKVDPNTILAQSLWRCQDCNQIVPDDSRHKCDGKIRVPCGDAACRDCYPLTAG